MIAMEQVTKTFGNGRGIFDLSFSVASGEVFGYLGPNGAGKSTTIRLLMGFLRSDHGDASIDGLNCWESAARVQQNVGYLPGEIGFFDDMTGTQFLDVIAGMRGRNSRARRDALIDRFELDPRQPIRKMSKGTKQKVGIIAAFMHQPRVLILDEPTAGLDPLMQQRFLDLVEEEKAQGATILMSSHLFAEVERVCDRVGILKAGQLAAIEDVRSLRALQRKVFTVVLGNAIETSHMHIPGCDIVAQRPHEIDIEVRGDNYNTMIRALSQYDIRALDVRPLDLEEIFMHFYAAEEAK